MSLAEDTFIYPPKLASHNHLPYFIHSWRYLQKQKQYFPITSRRGTNIPSVHNSFFSSRLSSKNNRVTIVSNQSFQFLRLAPDALEMPTSFAALQGPNTVQYLSKR